MTAVIDMLPDFQHLRHTESRADEVVYAIIQVRLVEIHRCTETKQAQGTAQSAKQPTVPKRPVRYTQWRTKKTALHLRTISFRR